MKKIFISIGILIVFSSCQRFYANHLVSQDRMEKERIYIEDCQDHWTYSDLSDSISIEVIHFRNQSGQSLSYFPSFFIGITSKSDTIGIIDYDYDGKIEIGEELFFSPGKSRMTSESGLIGHRPCLSVSYKRKHNKINCSVKNIYYGELIN